MQTSNSRESKRNNKLRTSSPIRLRPWRGGRRGSDGGRNRSFSSSRRSPAKDIDVEDEQKTKEITENDSSAEKQSNGSDTTEPMKTPRDKSSNGTKKQPIRAPIEKSSPPPSTKANEKSEPKVLVKPQHPTIQLTDEESLLSDLSGGSFDLSRYLANKDGSDRSTARPVLALTTTPRASNSVHTRGIVFPMGPPPVKKSSQ